VDGEVAPVISKHTYLQASRSCNLEDAGMTKLSKAWSISSGHAVVDMIYSHGSAENLLAHAVSLIVWCVVCTR